MNAEKRLPIVDKFESERRENKIELKSLENLTFAEIDPFLKKIVEISKSWNPVEIYTASNHQSQKDIFLKNFSENGMAENPQFIYEVAEKLDFSEQKIQLLKIRREVMDLAKKIKMESVGNQESKLKYLACMLMILKIKDDLTTVNMLEGIKTKDDEKTRMALGQKYGILDQELIIEAEKIYQTEEENNKTPKAEIAEVDEKTILQKDEQEWLINQKFDAKKIAEFFTWALGRYGFLAEKKGDFGFMVKIESGATSIDVRDKNLTEQPMIVIPENRVINGKQLLSLIGHEIEAHARQSMNGSKLFTFGGGSLKIDGEAAYEGLAKQADGRYEERYFGEKSAVPSPYYVKAIVMAQSGMTFRDVFKEIVKLKKVAENVTEINEKIMKSAWTITYRVFRGSTDPENKAHYAMPKDKAYLEGFLLSKQLEELGYDQYNQLAIATGAGIRMLGMFEVKKEDVPYPYLDLQRECWEEKLKPAFLMAKSEAAQVEKE